MFHSHTKSVIEKYLEHLRTTGSVTRKNHENEFKQITIRHQKLNAINEAKRIYTTRVLENRFLGTMLILFWFPSQTLHVIVKSILRIILACMCNLYRWTVVLLLWYLHQCRNWCQYFLSYYCIHLICTLVQASFFLFWLDSEIPSPLKISNINCLKTRHFDNISSKTNS